MVGTVIVTPPVGPGVYVTVILLRGYNGPEARTTLANIVMSRPRIVSSEESQEERLMDLI